MSPQKTSVATREVKVTPKARGHDGNEATNLISAFYKIVDDHMQPTNALEDFFAHDFKDNNRPSTAPEGVADRQVALKLFAELESGFPDGVHSLDILEAIGEDKAMVYWTFTGTHSGHFFGAPPSGNRISINGVDVFRVVDGRFVEQWHVEELMSLFQQISP